MAIQRKKLGEILVESGVITFEQLETALAEQNETGVKLGQILIKQGAMNEQQLVEVLEFTLGIPHVQISRMEIDPDAVKLVPPQIIKQYTVLPVSQRNNMITVAMADPLNQRAVDDINMASGLDVIPVLASERELEVAIRQYLAFRLDPGMEKLISELGSNGNGSRVPKKDLHLVKIDDDAPVVRMVNSILKQAVQGRCSDVHIEPQEMETRVRFRVDGELYEVMTLPQSSEAAIISRIKIMSGMDIAEKRVPQDGRFRMEIDSREVDFRVSTLPASYGEKVVLRILDRAGALTRIEQLGLAIDNRKKLISLARRPFGMMLLTGPTGSGKTTTMYSVLSEINSIDKNITTLEDPVEYSLAGINQVQVNSRAGLTFASGLRSMLRQDPDIIMVGEIRDEETARLAVQAALTGHLMFSTMHTNTAAGVVARLADMGIENFLISSALSGVVAQRLSRKLCPNCREPYIMDDETALRMNSPELAGQTFYHPGGCNMCRQLGYAGRIALHEVMPVGHEMRKYIARGDTSEDAIQAAALQEGLITIQEDGIAKAKQGLTSLEEVMKAVLLEGDKYGS